MVLMDVKEEILNGVSFLFKKVSEEVSKNQSYISDYLLDFIDDKLKNDVPGLFVYPHEAVQTKQYLPQNTPLIMEEKGYPTASFLSLVPAEIYPIHLSQLEFSVQQGVKIEPKLKLHFEKLRGDSIGRLMLHFPISRVAALELFRFILDSPTLIVRNASGIKVAQLEDAVKRLKIDSIHQEWCYLNHYPNLLSFIIIDLSQAASELDECSVFLLEFWDKSKGISTLALNTKQDAFLLERNKILSDISVEDILLNHIPVALRSKVSCEPFRIQPDIVHYPIIFDESTTHFASATAFSPTALASLNEIEKVFIKDQSQTLELMPLNKVNPLGPVHQAGLTYQHTVNENGVHQLTIPPVHHHKVLYADIIIYPEVKGGYSAHPKISHSLTRNRTERTMLLKAIIVALHSQFDDLNALNTALLCLLPEPIRPVTDFILNCTKSQGNIIQQGVWRHQTHFEFVLNEHFPNPILSLYWFKAWIEEHYPPTESIQVTLYHKELRYDTV